ncbi:mitochondrial RNA helicase [Kwoniella heveanensis BCC8398]|uniref:RNA helicase n=1 Tax=Kwoniella heveanensis BCC8398 TaxID=1296120 RepID=A0A1B9GJI8_9TREE|nr:mitochondrial RNA helicase [Kwoniella heveanensis BCC8398]
MSLARAGPSSLRPRSVSISMPSSLTLCRRCLLPRYTPSRFSPSPTSVLSLRSRSFGTTSRQLRIDKSTSQYSKPYKTKNDREFGASREPVVAAARQPLQLNVNDFDEKPLPRPRQIVSALLSRLPEWISSPRAQVKLEAYGISQDMHRRFEREWIRKVEDGLMGCEGDEEASVALKAGGWAEEDLIIAMHEGRLMSTLESMALRHYLSFLISTSTPSKPGKSPTATLELIPPSLKTHLKSILSATDLSRLSTSPEFLTARSLTRHFHLHIGPTNSGKTYNALKALSRAKSGAYAGPLRLLAHEVWERLNLGTVGDLNGEGKKCNLLTGEERRVVDPDAGLLSCTVEMLPLSGLGGQGFDVVVIDEIQMLGDDQRGGSWTKAVLGVAAKEVHLCGDETTVQLLHNLLLPLGDKLTVHRYNRLTPLTVAEESLENNYDKVEPGDCIVTFSRTNIFAVKKMVESTAGKKCAVVYGALPPETRAEQARDFNDEKGLSQVLVASDAVGMGLNLKIKRMIFESLSKFNGKTEVPLALTQIKQIAGRAGRYKTANDTDQDADKDAGKQLNNIATPDETPAAGGLVTTLHKADLPILRELMTRDLPSIPRAKLEVPYGNMAELASLLPSNTSFASLLEHFAALAQPPAYTVLSAYEHKLPLADVVEPFRDRLSLKEIDQFCFAPVNVRDDRAKAIFRNLVEDFADQGCVNLDDIFASSRLLNQLDLVEETLRTLPPLPPVLGIGRRLLTPPVIISSIPMLETLHKSLVLYIWLSFRLEVAFPDRAQAVEAKNRTEIVLDQCLERLPGLRQRKQSRGERGKEVDRLVRDWRRANVMPNGTRKVEGVPRKGLTWLERNVAQRAKERQVWRNAKVIGGDEGESEVESERK